MSQGLVTSSSNPAANAGPATPIFFGGTPANPTEKTLAASGAYSYSDVIVPCATARTITLFLSYDPAAIGGYPVIIPLVSCSAAVPANNDDSWFQVPISDGTFTVSTLTGALPAGADFTVAPGVGVSQVRGLAIQPCAAAAAGTNEVRVAVTLNIAPYRFFQFVVAEVGATGSPGALLATYSMST